MLYATQLLLKFQSQVSFKDAGDLRLFFDTASNSLAYSETLTLILKGGKVYFLAGSRPLLDLEQDEVEVEIDAMAFRNKVAMNALRFEFDNESIRLTLARSLAAAIMSQTHTPGLHKDLATPDKDYTDIDLHLQQNLHAGALYVAPIVIVMYFILQYLYYFYKTGLLLTWRDPQLKQMLRDSVIVGLQSLMVAMSFALARAFIPLLLHTLDFQFSGPLIHLVIAPLFGLMFASSLLLYDLMASRTAYGQLTISPWTRFCKNFIIGSSLYLVQLLPGLGGLQSFESTGRALLAFTIPNAVNYTANCLPGWGRKKDTVYPGTLHNTSADASPAFNFYR